MSPVGGPEVHQIATGSGPANSIFDAEPDFTGLGVVEGIIATVVLTQIILVVSLFLEVSLGRSTWRLSNHLAQSQLFGQLILDQITVTVVSLSTSFFTVLVHSPSMSAYPRRIVQLCLSLSNIASLTLFVSRPIGVKQLLIVFIISLAWFSVSFRNTLDGVSVSAELEWLESGQDQIKDSSPLPETTNAIVPGLACLLVILLRWRYHRKIDGIGDLGCLIIGIPLILSDVVEIRDLREKYQPHIDYDAETTFGFGQLIALLLPLAPIISAIESYTIAPPQPRNNKVSEDVPESQIGLHRL
ncbi:hypothetical protein B0H66DRAFT_378200 [Apodospora peruviana]|uniref:Uncharacterized protein n=1 Tax=Apodospora peruviana TaxID=516989 RepID=A0AAE0HTY4_9PEZI|nr:hypothetical protein B0H66DRAFT_378200 [Apodospora peruviana]